MATRTSTTTALAPQQGGSSPAPRTTSSLDPSHLPPIYAMTVEGTCLEPRIKDGTVLMFTTTEAPKADDLAVFYRRPEVVREGQYQNLVKRLLTTEPVPCMSSNWAGVRMAYIAEMDNPPARLVFPVADLLAIHKCLGPVPKRVKRVKVSDAELEAEYQARVAAGQVSAGAPTKEQTAVAAAGSPTLPMPVFDALPPWHALVPIGADSSGAPYFRPGEFAVVDTTARQPMAGEIFAMAATSPRYGQKCPLRLVETTGKDNDWSYRAPIARQEIERWHRWRDKPECERAASGVLAFNILSDGPYSAADLAQMLCGRVVGVYGPTLRSIEGGRTNG
jgi:hypothetical protein